MCVALSAQGFQSCSVSGRKLLEHHQQTQRLLWSLHEIQLDLATRKVSGLREGCVWDRSEAHQQGFQAMAGSSYSLVQELCS